MSVSTFGMWFIGLGLLFFIGLGYLFIQVDFRIDKIEQDGWGKRSGKHASKWMHRIKTFCFVLSIIGLLMLIASGRCLFWPGPFCTALYP